jgi:hypothetical protein
VTGAPIIDLGGWGFMATCYRCEKKFGDACEFALARRVFSEDELPPAIRGGNPKCPGQTVSGKDCGAELVPLPCKGRGGIPIDAKRAKPIAVGAGAAAVIALAVYFWPDAGTLVLTPETLVFPYSEDLQSSAVIEMHNLSNRPVVIDRIDFSSPLFSASDLPAEVPPEGSKTMLIHFQGRDATTVEGDAMLHSDLEGAPTRVHLVANRTPWWVYDNLEQQSTLLRTEP